MQHLVLLGGGIISLGIVSIIAYLSGYYGFKKKWFTLPPLVSVYKVLGIFLVFLGIELIIVPLAALLYLSMQAGQLIDVSKTHLSLATQGWLNFFAILASAIGIFLYLWSQWPIVRRYICWGSIESSKHINRGIKDFLLGCATWIISYPFIIISSQLIALMISVFIAPTQIDQVAVKQLKMTMNDPVLYMFTAFAMICLAPPVEEVIFRGFLQRWLVDRIGIFTGIILTSLLFAFFHFSISQSWENIELLSSLFILSCFLGFLYERQGSLLAPIGLHVTFNAVSIALITWGDFR